MQDRIRETQELEALSAMFGGFTRARRGRQRSDAELADSLSLTLDAHGVRSGGGVYPRVAGGWITFECTKTRGAQRELEALVLALEGVAGVQFRSIPVATRVELAPTL